MVASSSPAASEVGERILCKGGNATDAAVAMAAALPVVEPTCNGLGSDLFCLYWDGETLHGYNGSGKSPRRLDLHHCPTCETLPKDGVLPIMTPGAVAGWVDLHETFGSLAFEEVLAPAISLAEEGFIVGEQLALLWEESFQRFLPHREESLYGPWFSIFAPKGRAPRAGEIVSLPELGKSLRAIAKTKGEAFYRGEIAEAIDETMREVGGFFRKEDLEVHRGMFVDPISVRYRGVDVWEIPPNGHGIAVLVALGILEEMDLQSMSEIERQHALIEAMKLAYVDIKEVVADQEYMEVSVEELLDTAYHQGRRDLIASRATSPVPSFGASPSTVYFAVADEAGRMVSMIQSNFDGFGSGVVVPEWGVALNNRGCNFNLRKGHPNCVGPNKRSYHTIIPGFMTKDGEAFGAFGVMGGFMQPQGQLQVISRLLDEGCTAQEALDAPRWQWKEGCRLDVEREFGQELLQGLEEKGHLLTRLDDYREMGRGQIILRHGEIYSGGTEKRTDGVILGIQGGQS